MAVNLIVLVVTLLMAAFVGAWILLPWLRSWFESPKHRFLEQQRLFPSIVRDAPTDKDVDRRFDSST